MSLHKDYPVAIFQDRYLGAYSGGKWIAVAAWDSTEGENIRDSIYDHDILCMRFWDEYRNSPLIGVGNTPAAALKNLMEKNK